MTRVCGDCWRPMQMESVVRQLEQLKAVNRQLQDAVRVASVSAWIVPDR